VTTFLLIHGAYQGGWIWKPVAERLRAAGHQVFAPSLDGCGERAAHLRSGITTESQAEELAKLLEFEDLSDVVVVGTSAGGMVAVKLAELARDRVARLVLIDALALLNGESIRDIVKNSAASIVTEVATGPAREDRVAKLLRDLDKDTAEWAADRFGLHPIAVFNQGVVLDRFWDQDWDVAVILCRQAENPGEAHQRRTAEKLHARWHELNTGHYPMLSAPDELTRLILEG